MSIVLNTDFKGEYKVPNTCFDELDVFIEKYEKHYLLQLLGAELYGLFKADLTVIDPQTPQTARFLSVFNEFDLDISACLFSSSGMRKMLVKFIYFHYVRESQLLNTVGGTVSNAVELGLPASYKSNIIQAFNEGVDDFKTIQWYICDNTTDYPEENTQYLDYTSGI